MPPLHVEGLERRIVLTAGIVLDRAARTLSIVGSAGNDVAEVRQQGATVVVSLASATGRVSRSVPAALVSRVVFMGHAGNDSFTNQTAIASRADGGRGADVLRGGRGGDELIGGDGNDRLLGNAGDDMLDGGSGGDSISGEDGHDMLLAGGGNDRISGGGGHDDLHGGAGDDSLLAGPGNDMLDGDVGSDQLVGGEGFDQEVDPQDRFTDGDDDGDGYDNDYPHLDILFESPGNVSAYADDATVAPIIDAVAADVRGLLQLPADDAGLRVRVARERFGTLVTGTWRYLTPDRIQVWGRWAYPESDPSQLNAAAQYSYKGPYSGDIDDYSNPANYVLSEERRVYANSARGPLNFVSWLPERPANFFFSALNPQAIEALRLALGSMPNFTNRGDTFSGDFSSSPGLPGVLPVVELVRTVNELSGNALAQPPSRPA